MNRPHIVLLFGIEVVVKYAFAVAIDVEVNGTGGYDADKASAETFEERSETFMCVYLTKDLACFAQVAPARCRNREECGAW